MREVWRGREIFQLLVTSQYERVTRMFIWLLAVQWVAEILAAVWISPLTWIGDQHHVHLHLRMAVLLGGLLTVPAIVVGIRRPAATGTRHLIAVSQALHSALLIHLTGGRIETHFHVFGSLAFLAFYRDWRVLVTATVIVAGDHAARGVLAPLSVFGTVSSSQWRWLEHSAWVLFEDIVLFGACRQGEREMRSIALDRAALESSRDSVEEQVRERTAELIRTAAALGERERELRAAKDEAEGASRAKSDFLANMSHEIRTPMTAILGFADVLSDPSQSAEQRTGCVETIRRNGEHLLNLINDILDISKIEAGKMTVEAIDCSPRQIAREAHTLMMVRAMAKGIDLRFECEESVPRVMSDPIRLLQVLVNLVGNAIKFTEQGSVVIRVDGLPADDEAGMCDLRITVRDTGIGMTTAQLERVFGAFEQADRSTTRRFGGTGLGLRISRRLANLLGGDISVRSEPGRGSEFALMLRCRLSEAECERRSDGTEMRPPRAAEVETERLSGSILVAEDGIDNQRLISHFLRKAGAEVVIAENGAVAVACALEARTAGRQFDLVLMDMQMPEMDGYTAARTLREHGWEGPIVALTAHAMNGDREKCLAAGCQGYLTKPIDRVRMIRACARYIEEWTARRAAA